MQEKIIIPVMFCFDKNYCVPASVAFYSLLENTAKCVSGDVEFLKRANSAILRDFGDSTNSTNPLDSTGDFVANRGGAARL
ncbi:hypothetical protein CCY99_06415 [Helicobacter sp. 16-1353]|uniref:glycosyltransferase family 8 protein n=1 Tax=Helicobacter sp. 16-1353 TaxID=2004996 RepID=UPI000DCEFF3D|nr:glycosyltransferase family 8 protein [Helicobacter sp. 16-1353]RAX52998.1 hypothetical protein CCY99_06415 [Helicobacter sp. 16-1353]